MDTWDAIFNQTSLDLGDFVMVPTGEFASAPIFCGCRTTSCCYDHGLGRVGVYFWRLFFSSTNSLQIGKYQLFSTVQ